MRKDKNGMCYFGPEENAAQQREIERLRVPVHSNVYDYYKPENQVKGTLHDWQAVIDNIHKDYHFHLYGRFESNDGKTIKEGLCTSRVIKIEDRFAYTRNSIYRLGYPSTRRF